MKPSPTLPFTTASRLPEAAISTPPVDEVRRFVATMTRLHKAVLELAERPGNDLGETLEKRCRRMAYLLVIEGVFDACALESKGKGGTWESFSDVALGGMASRLRGDEDVPPLRLERELGLPYHEGLSAVCDAVDARFDALVERILSLIGRLQDLLIKNTCEAQAAGFFYRADIVRTALTAMPSLESIIGDAKLAFHPASQIVLQGVEQRAPVDVFKPTAPDPVIATQRARIAQLESGNAELEQKLREAQELFVRGGREATEADADQDSQRALRARIVYLEARERELQQAAKKPPAAIAIPQSWDALEDFAGRHLGGRVTLSAKAVRAARASVYRNIPHAYRVLLMLAEDYVPMKRGEEGARSRYDANCARLGVDIRPTGAALESHQYRASYQFVHAGRRYDMDLHVRGSSSRDAGEGFRLYFTWVAPKGEPGYVLVGSFPEHLDSYLTD